MSAKILDGKALAENIKYELKQSIKDQNLTNKITLAVIVVGHDPASRLYVKNKKLACEFVGIHVDNHELDENISKADLLGLLDRLNNDPSVHGILLQLPLPKIFVDKYKNINSLILEKITPNKDVDGFNPFNMGKLSQRCPNIRPCTPKGIMRLLEHYQINVKSQKVTIVGASNIVGRPLALEMLIAGATTTVCHKFTKDLQEHCYQADIICSAVGIPNLIKGNYIKPGAVVIDIGINKMADGTFCGDIEFNKAKEVASYITPVPGGIGPMTVAMLLENTIECYKILSDHSMLIN